MYQKLFVAKLDLPADDGTVMVDRHRLCGISQIGLDVEHEVVMLRPVVVTVDDLAVKVYPLSVEGVAKAKRDPANAVLQANQARLLALIPAARLDERQPEEISCLDHVIEWLHGLRLPRSHLKVNRCI